MTAPREIEQCSRCGRPESATCCATPPAPREVTAETLTDADVQRFGTTLNRDPLTIEVRDLLIDCNRVGRAMAHGIGAVHGQHPHWYYDAARARIAAAINARAKAGR